MDRFSYLVWTLSVLFLLTPRTASAQSSSYCSASASSASWEWISEVELGALSNSSSSKAGYENYTALSVSAERGSNIAFELTPGYSSSQYYEYWAIWIDFNRDGDFSDPNEEVFRTANSTNQPVSGSFSIPSNAHLGETRLRVVMSYYNSQLSPCGQVTYGQVEDYTIRIADPEAGEGEGEAGLDVASITNLAQGHLSRLYAESGSVTLTNITEHQFRSPIEGFRGFYTATIAGGERLTWGTIDSAWQVVHSGLAHVDDPEGSIPLLAESLALFWSQAHSETAIEVDGELKAYYLGGVGGYLRRRLGDQAFLNARDVVKLSEELQVTFLDAHLDTFQAKGIPPFSGVVPGIDSPLRGVLQSLRVSLDQVERLIRRGLDSVDLDAQNSDQQRVAQRFYTTMYYAMHSRAGDAARKLFPENLDREEELIRLILDRITDVDRGTHPYFEELFRAVSGYHLFVPFGQRLPYKLQRPELVVKMLDEWLAKNDFSSASDFFQQTAISTLYKLQYSLEDPVEANKAKTAATQLLRDWILEASSAGGTSRLEDVMRVVESRMEGFGNFDSSTRQLFIGLLSSRFVEPGKETNRSIRFLQEINSLFELSSADRQTIDYYFRASLDAYVFELSTLSPPSADAENLGHFGDVLEMSVELSKTYHQKERLTPYLSASNRRFEGAGGHSAETQAEYTARMVIINRIWEDHDVFIIDLLSAFGRDVRLLESLEAAMDVIGRGVVSFTNTILIRNLGSGPAGNFGAQKRGNHLELRIPMTSFGFDINKEGDLKRQWGFSSVNILVHEMMHSFMSGFTLEEQSRWEEIYAKADRVRNSSGEDLLANFLNNYARTNEQEDFAETMRAWYFQHSVLLYRGVIAAKAKGQYALLEKYLFIAERISRIESNGSTYSINSIADLWDYDARVEPNDRTKIEFLPSSTMEVLLRDANGRITLLSDGKRHYRFVYQNGELVYVHVRYQRYGDVDGNNAVTPGDVLTLINEINSGSRWSTGFYTGVHPWEDLFDRGIFPPRMETYLDPYLLDISQDGLLSPVDALIVINVLNGY